MSERKKGDAKEAAKLLRKRLRAELNLGRSAVSVRQGGSAPLGSEYSEMLWVELKVHTDLVALRTLCNKFEVESNMFIATETTGLDWRADHGWRTDHG